MYIIFNVEDILFFHHDARPDLDRIDQLMKLKEGYVGDPDIYLGEIFKKVQISNDVLCWSLSQSKYVQKAVQNCQNNLKENYSGEYELTANSSNPFTLGYKPDMDVPL